MKQEIPFSNPNLPPDGSSLFVILEEDGTATVRYDGHNHDISDMVYDINHGFGNFSSKRKALNKEGYQQMPPKGKTYVY